MGLSLGGRIASNHIVIVEDAGGGQGAETGFAYLHLARLTEVTGSVEGVSARSSLGGAKKTPACRR